nr:MAG TPA: hypothetical protein [Caudoviricetes sp.]
MPDGGSCSILVKSSEADGNKQSLWRGERFPNSAASPPRRHYSEFP